jgi:hypothetical protein
VIDIDPAVAGGWRPGDARNSLCLAVDDPVRSWAALCDVLDELVTPPALREWSSVLVAPAGLQFCGWGDDPRPVLAELGPRLAERGLTAGRLSLDDDDGSQPEALLDVAAASSWVTAWLVPLMVPGVDFTYRTLREWRVRRFPPGCAAKVAAHAVAMAGPGAGPARSGWLGGIVEVPPDELPHFAQRWVEHGIICVSTGLGSFDATPSVLVTSVRRGTELLGVGRAGVGLVDDLVAARRVVDELTELIVSMADVLAYAVIGVHEDGRMPAIATPFREVVPATARAQSRGLSLAALDQWVLDAAPVQLLNRHHRLSRGGDVTEEAVSADRRLVRIGGLDDWFSGPSRRTQIRNRGRQALADCLPPPRTPMPPAVL